MHSPLLSSPSTTKKLTALLISPVVDPSILFEQRSIRDRSTHLNFSFPFPAHRCKNVVSPFPATPLSVAHPPTPTPTSRHGRLPPFYLYVNLQRKRHHDYFPLPFSVKVASTLHGDHLGESIRVIPPYHSFSSLARDKLTVPPRQMRTGRPFLLNATDAFLFSPTFGAAAYEIPFTSFLLGHPVLRRSLSSSSSLPRRRGATNFFLSSHVPLHSTSSISPAPTSLFFSSSPPHATPGFYLAFFSPFLYLRPERIAHCTFPLLFFRFFMTRTTDGTALFFPVAPSVALSFGSTLKRDRSTRSPFFSFWYRKFFPHYVFFLLFSHSHLHSNKAPRRTLSPALFRSYLVEEDGPPFFLSQRPRSGPSLLTSIAIIFFCSTLFYLYVASHLGSSPFPLHGLQLRFSVLVPPPLTPDKLERAPPPFPLPSPFPALRLSKRTATYLSLPLFVTVVTTSRAINRDPLGFR